MTQAKREDAPLSPEAKAFADNLFACEPPCDSFGVCDQCCERTVFGAGYNFGHRAASAELAQLTAAAEARGRESAKAQMLAEDHARITQLTAQLKESERREALWKALAESRASLLSCYRLGKRPSETLLDRLETLRRALADTGAEGA